MSTIGDNIRRIRTEKGMTQDDLAKVVGTTTTAISRYELSSREPRYARLQEIANALEVPIEQLTSTQPDQVENNEKYPPIRLEDRRQQKRVSTLLAAFLSLSERGQNEALKRVSEMTQLSQYQNVQGNLSLSEALLQYATQKTGVVYRVQVEKTEEELFPSHEPFGGDDTSLTVQHIILESATSTKSQWWHFWCYLSPVSDTELEEIMSCHAPDSFREQVTLVVADQSNAETAIQVWEHRQFDSNPDEIPDFAVLYVQEGETGDWVIQDEYGLGI